MRILISILAAVISMPITAVLVYFAVLFLAGPHGGVLPPSLHLITLAFGWIVVVAVPLFVGRWVWQRFSRNRN